MLTAPFSLCKTTSSSALISITLSLFMTIDKAPGDVETREKALGAELESYKDKAQDIVLGAQNDASEITEQIVSLRGQIIPMQEAIDDLNGKKDPVSIEQRSELKDAVKELRADIDSLGKDYKIMVDKADIADSFLTQIADNPRMSLEERVEAAHGSAEAMGITKEEMGQFRVDAETLEGKAESKVENDAEKALDTFDPAKTVEAEDLSKTVDRQDPSKATEHQDPSKAVEQQDLSKAVEQADPSKAVEQEDSSKAADKEDPLKTVEREDPSKSVEQEDPSKAVEAEDPSKIVESEFAQEIQVDNPEDAVGDGAVSDGEDTIDVDETTPDESVADTEHDNSPSSDKGDDAAALEDSVSPDNEGDTYIDNDGGDKPDSGSDDTDNSSKDSTDSEDNGSERDGTSNDTKEESSETADTGNSKNDEPDDDDFESAVDTESGGGNRSVSSTGSREDDDDASIVAGAEQGASKSDIFDALDKYLEQGEDGTFSFKEDFLDEKGDKISKEDLQEAFSEKIGEIEDEIKSGDVDDDKIDKMSDVIGDIFDFQIEHYMSRIEDLGNFIDAILDRDFSSAGNMIIENFLDKVSADLEPLSKMADFINEHVDPDGAMAGESLKESIVEQLDNIGLDFSDANIDKIVDIADTLNNIFDGFENLLTGMAETYSADVDLGVDVMDAMPEMDSVDAHELAESLQAQAEITEAAIDGDVMANSVQPPDFPDDSFDSDFDISDYSLQDNVDSLHDVLNGIDNSMDAAIEAATEEMSVEEIVAMLL